MKTLRAKKERNRIDNRVFFIQLFEFGVSVIFINLGFFLGGRLIYNDFIPFPMIEGILLYGMITALSIFLLWYVKFFESQAKSFGEELAKVILAVILINFCFIALLYFTRAIRLSPHFFIVADVFILLGLVTLKRVTGGWKVKLSEGKRYLVVGGEKESKPLMQSMIKLGLQNIASILPDVDNLNSYMKEADIVVLCDKVNKKLKDTALNYCVLYGKTVFIVPETYEIAMQKVDITQIGDIPIFRIDRFSLTQRQKIVKRFIDLSCGILGLILASPIMLVAAIAIKKEDGGPVFFKQTRSGLYGKEFQVVKFRSMKVDAEKSTGAVFAAKNDDRITKVGHFIRATRVDEIPQFINVMRGEMSLIGPRPERPVFIEKFKEEIPDYINRLAVKPGITGLAQVLGNYTTTAENKVKFDLMYIKNYSIFLDLKIILYTIKVVFTKEQAEGFTETKATKEEPVSGISTEPLPNANLAFAMNTGSVIMTGASPESMHGINSRSMSGVSLTSSIDLGKGQAMPGLAFTGNTVDVRPSFDLEATMEKNSGKSGSGESRRRIRDSWWMKSMKGVAVGLCGLVVVVGAMGFRYTSIAGAMANAIFQPGVLDGQVQSLLVLDSLLNSDDLNGGNDGQINSPVDGTINGSSNADSNNGTMDSSGQGVGNDDKNGIVDIATIIASANLKNKFSFLTPQNVVSVAGYTTTGQIKMKDANTALTEEEIKETLKSFSMEDKFDIVMKFISKLSTEDLMAIEEMAKDGFTEKEKEKAKEMIYKYFTEEEIEYIKEVYHQVVG